MVIFLISMDAVVVIEIGNTYIVSFTKISLRIMSNEVVKAISLFDTVKLLFSSFYICIYN